MTSYLEDFGPAALAQPAPEDAATEADEDRLAAFDQGYSAGWDDAIAAQSRNTHIATEEFARNLRDLSFTYQEAVQHVTKSLEPFLHALVETLVPTALEAGLAQKIAEQIGTAAEVSQSTEVLVQCSPMRQSLLSEALPDVLDMPVAVQSAPDMGRDEVVVKFQNTEQQFALSDVTEHIRQAIEAFTVEAKRDHSHG